MRGRPVPCSRVGARGEPLAAPPAAKAARRRGVRIKKVFVGVGADPGRCEARRGPTPPARPGVLSSAGVGAVGEPGTGFLLRSVQSIAGCRARFAYPAGRGDCSCCSAPRDPEMKPVNGKGWAPAGWALFLP